MSDIVPANQDELIRSRILTVRGMQVLLDRDLAELYGVTTGALNQAVKRNKSRFPERFMFQLSKAEDQILKSQIVISSWSDSDKTGNLKSQSVISTWGGSRACPNAFTEQGIAMLASVLRSETAIAVSIRIMDVFVAMRRTLASLTPFLSRIEAVERRQIIEQSRNDENQKLNEERFETIFKAMDGGDFPAQKVFFEGKHYEAYSFVRKLVRKATESIVLVDGYCDDATLDILSNKRGGVNATIATSSRSAKRLITPTALEKFNKQNPALEIRETGVFHDRFLIIDGKELYHFGTSLKDLGRQYCAVSKLDASFIPSIQERI